MTREQHAPSDELSPRDVALLRRQLSARVESAVLERPSTDAMLRYLAGLLPEQEADAVVSAAVLSKELRIELVGLRGKLSALCELAPAELERQAAAEQGGAATAWSAILAEQLRAAAEPKRAAWLGRAFEEVRQGAAAGVIAAQSAWNELLLSGRSLSLSLRQPAPALSRGAEDDEGVTIGRLGLYEIWLRSAEIDREGTLTVTAELRGGTATANEEATLVLETGGASCVLGTARPEHGLLIWRTPDVGALLELPAGSLPGRYLRAGAPDVALAAAESRTLFAGISGGAGGVAVRMRQAPLSRPGLLQVGVEMEPVDWQAHLDHTLVLSLVVSAAARQRLGSWPLRDWKDGRAEIEINLPAEMRTIGDVSGLIGAELR